MASGNVNHYLSVYGEAQRRSYFVMDHKVVDECFFDLVEARVDDPDDVVQGDQRADFSKM